MQDQLSSTLWEDGLALTDASLIIQLIRIISIGLFVTIASTITWFTITLIAGLGPSAEEELIDLDKSECGMDAYAELD